MAERIVASGEGRWQGCVRLGFLPIAIATLAACSSTPFTVAWQYSSDQPEFALLERCISDDLAVAKKKGVAEQAGTVSRRQAEAMRRLLEIVDAGDTPTEREYRRAGC